MAPYNSQLGDSSVNSYVYIGRDKLSTITLLNQFYRKEAFLDTAIMELYRDLYLLKTLE